MVDGCSFLVGSTVVCKEGLGVLFSSSPKAVLIWYCWPLALIKAIMLLLYNSASHRGD